MFGLLGFRSSVRLYFLTSTCDCLNIECIFDFSSKSTVDALERRCEDLLTVIDERNHQDANSKRVAEKNETGWSSNLHFISNDNKLRRVISCENSIWTCDDYCHVSCSFLGYNISRYSAVLNLSAKAYNKCLLHSFWSVSCNFVPLFIALTVTYDFLGVALLSTCPYYLHLSAR